MESNIDNTNNSTEKPNRLRQILTQIFCTKIGWLFLTLALAVVFGVIADRTDCNWCSIAMYICFIYPVVLTLIMLVYAWIINPLRDYRENKKLKEQNKNNNA
jgi:membrane protein YdbS with pleckstrin-like domain